MKPRFDSTPRGLLPALAAALVLAAAPAWPQEADDAGTAPEAAEPATAEQPGVAEPESAAAKKPGEADRPAGGAEAGAREEGAAEAAGDTEGEKTADDGGPLVVEAEEGSVLDDQTFEGEDDDFTPSEEIPVDEPIPFPTDI